MIDLKKLSYRYPQQKDDVISNLDLSIKAGEKILLVGPTGCAKTTLLKIIVGLIPRFSGGTISGKIKIAGIDPTQSSPLSMAQKIGFIFQDPENQLTCTRVEDELAFSGEIHNQSVAEIEQNINKTLTQLSITHLKHRTTQTLSSGEKQKIALAATLIADPDIILADEPTSQLDPSSAQNFLQILDELNRVQDTTIIISEHRIDRIHGFPHRIFDMAQGEFISWGQAKHRYLPTTTKRPKQKIREEPLLTVEQLSYSYASQAVFQNLSFTLNEKEILGIVGENGVGKSTLLKNLNGLLQPNHGRIILKGKDITDKEVEEKSDKIGLLGQNPHHYLTQETVGEEIALTQKFQNLPQNPTPILQELGLAKLQDAYPAELSGGQRQLVALAAVLAAQPKIILLDEPTRGLDWQLKKQLTTTMQNLTRKGCAIILVTHDQLLAKTACERIITMNAQGMKHENN